MLTTRPPIPPSGSNHFSRSWLFGAVVPRIYFIKEICPLQSICNPGGFLLFWSVLKKFYYYYYYIKYSYSYKNITLTRENVINDLGVTLDCKLYFHHHIDRIFSDSLKMLGLISRITSDYCTLDCLTVLYNALLRPKLEYGSVIWNCITQTDSKKLESIKKKFVNYVSIDSIHLNLISITKI